MILFFKAWCENIIIGVVILVIIEMICPSRFVKYVKIIASIFLLYLIISPIINNISSFSLESILRDIKVNSDKLIDENQKYNINDSDQDTDGDINNKNFKLDVNKIYIDSIKIRIKNRLLEEGFGNFNINLLINDNLQEIEKIEVINNSVNSKNDEDSDSVLNKRMDSIKEIICEEINIDKKQIIIK